MPLEDLCVLSGSLRTRGAAISIIHVPSSADGYCTPSQPRKQARFCCLLHKGKSGACPLCLHLLQKQAAKHPRVV